MEYWGQAWADYCDISYIASSASDVSALLVCMALHPQITHRQFSVAPISISTSQNSSTVSPSVVSDSHWHVGKLPNSYTSRYSSTISVGWISLYHVSAHSPISHSVFVGIILTADKVQSSAVVYHAPEYMEHFRAYTDLGNQGVTNAG